jgi:arabinan endo-1,5-alpha-L-arabinosidase
MKYLHPFLILGLLFTTLACKKAPTDQPVPIVPSNTYQAPSYFDDYAAIASWDNRTKWNLANVHDPTVTKCGDYYYMYQTDASYGNALDGHGHFPYRRSKDLVTWEFMGTAFANVPVWVKDSLNNKRARMVPALPPIANPDYGCWAPCIRKVGNKYRMYYSVVVTNCIAGTDPNYSWTERGFIGLAESDDLATNIWVDKGMVACSEPDGKEDYLRTGPNDWSGYFKFNAIDPSYIITPEGDHWLIYGSWHSGIAAVKLNPDTGKPNIWKTINDFGVRIAGRGNILTNRWQALEGAEIIYNEATQYYYLFMAYDELSVAYNTRVARSTSITGPFVGIDGNNVTDGAECWPILTHPYAFNGHPGWVGVSHCAVFQNPDSKQWYYSSQGRLPAGTNGNAYANAIMMGQVREVSWTATGWPVLSPERYAAVPTTTILESSLIGTWEQITLKYQYKAIQTSIPLILSSDHTFSGGASGTWKYDVAKKTLTLNNTTDLLVNDGLDWEASSRKPTLVFTGLTSAGLSVWGKKIK